MSALRAVRFMPKPAAAPQPQEQQVDERQPGQIPAPPPILSLSTARAYYWASRQCFYCEEFGPCAHREWEVAAAEVARMAKVNNNENNGGGNQ